MMVISMIFSAYFLDFAFHWILFIYQARLRAIGMSIARQAGDEKRARMRTNPFMKPHFTLQGSGSRENHLNQLVYWRAIPGNC